MGGFFDVSELSELGYYVTYCKIESYNTASCKIIPIALIGGGSNPKPGEVTLAHNGILFLDELGEFSKHVLEVLRQPMEDKCVTVARANRSLCFPSSFMLVAATNPCPCGWLGSTTKRCQCSPLQVQKYLSKISGPLLDRIDIHLQVPAIKPHELIVSPTVESSWQIKKRAMGARDIQLKRFNLCGVHTNAQMNSAQMKEYCRINEETQGLLRKAIETLGLSARAHDKILRVARTIADLAGAENIETPHVAEAISYRSLDRVG